MSANLYDDPESTHEYLSTFFLKNFWRFVPLSNIISALSIYLASFIKRDPPSPQVIFFVSWKL